MRIPQFRSRILSHKIFSYRKRDRSVTLVLKRCISVEGVFFEVSGHCYFQDRHVARLFYRNLQDLIRSFKGREGSRFESSFRRI